MLGNLSLHGSMCATVNIRHPRVMIRHCMLVFLKSVHRIHVLQGLPDIDSFAFVPPVINAGRSTGSAAARKLRIP